jgi:energy-coupling factor transporter ATP-binding protein EcfA2
MSGQDLRANPYVGLRPFFADDSLYFFGREQQTAELLEILRQHRFLGVVGSSGSGKSSLVRAGLLPALLGGFLVQDRDRWRTVQMKPGDAPIVNLAAELLEAMEQAPTPTSVAELEKEIREGHTDAVLEFLAPRLESNANLFLLVDQFEEIFAFRGIDHEDEEQSEDPVRRKERARRKAEASDFVDLLLALAEQRKLPIYVALTMRTDFLGDCDLFYGLPEALNRGRYLVPRMTREQLRQAVECPALLPGAEIAPRLMDHLLNELGDRFDRLPVLQHALLRTWDEWQRAGAVGPIDLRHFESAGGLEHALDQDAEGALKGLDIGVTARVFKRLTDTDLSQRRVRSPARISELVAAAGVDRQTVGDCPPVRRGWAQLRAPVRRWQAG